MWLRNFKIWLVALSVALISACGSQDSGGSANAGLMANNKSASNANTSLLDSLAVLYPKGQMSEQQKTLAAKELLQNPAALRKTAPASAAISAQSSSRTVAAQVATGNFGPVSRIQNTTLSGSYFFTIYDFERDSALALHPEWKLEGTAFYTSRVAAPGLSPVHRFQNKLNGSYLYSIYETERADIAANYSDFFAYEGVSWYASQTAQAGYTPLFRFRNKVNGTYLFSSYESEKDAILANYADIFVLEGIAYYVRQTDPLELSLLAGGLGGLGNLDGVGSEARFGSSNGVAFDAAGNAFVADAGSRIIRKVTPAGEVSTIAGKSNVFDDTSVDGTGTAARFRQLNGGIVIDSSGNLFVADHRSIRKITPDAIVTTFAGNKAANYLLDASPYVDGTGTAADFKSISGITIDSANNLYVADTYVIRKVTPAGEVTTIAGDVTGANSPPVDGPALTARFGRLGQITVDGANNLFVNEGRLIRKITAAGMVGPFAGQSASGAPQDGTGTAARFGSISALRADASGNVFVADRQTRSIRKVSPAGEVTTFAGPLPNSTLLASSPTPLDGTGNGAQFSSPAALALDASGNLSVMDFGLLRKITPTAVVTTIAGKSAQTGTTDGTGAAARFNGSSNMVFDNTGNMFVLSTREGLVRKITPEGVVTTFAGGGAFSSANPTGDGTGTSATFQFPVALAIDAANNLYVAGSGTVRKVSPAGVVTTIAGVTFPGFNTTPVDGTGTAARFSFLSGIVVDSVGNLFVTDGRTIRKITPTAEVTTFAGSATSTGSSADGNGVAAKFQFLQNIAIDGAGVLFVTDAGKIRKITLSADVSTYAGALGFGYVDGDLSVAKFSVSSMVFDASNNMYIADGGNNVVRKITAAGQVSTVVGTAGRMGVVEGLLSGIANLNRPSAVAVYGGKLYIFDENSVLKVNGLP